MGVGRVEFAASSRRKSCQRLRDCSVGNMRGREMSGPRLPNIV